VNNRLTEVLGSGKVCRVATPFRALGFSVVELLVAVAVLALLGTVAAPRLMAFRMCVAQSEAKADLGFIAGAERAYFAEHETYTDDLGLLKIVISGAPRYLYGFTSDVLPAPSGRNDTAELRAAGGGAYGTSRMVDAFGVILSEGDLPAALVTANSFCVGAVGRSDLDPTLDRWTMTGDGVIVHAAIPAIDDIENRLQP